MVSIGELSAIALTFVVITLIVGYGTSVLADAKGGVTDTNANTTIDNGVTGLSNMSSKFGTLGTIIIASVIIGVIATAFVISRR